MKQLLTLFFLGTLLLCANAQSKQPLRFVHAIPDAGPVDVRVGGKTIFNNVKFGTVTTSVFLTTNEALDVSVVTAVTKSALLEDTFTFEGPLTIAAIGTLNTEANPALLIGYPDSTDGAAPGKKEAAVRAINFIVNTPELVVESTKVIKGTDQLLTETLAFGVPTSYEIIPESIYNLIIATAEDDTKVIYKPGATFAAKNFYTIFLFGDYSTGSASKAAIDAARAGNYATVGAARNLFLNIQNDGKQLSTVKEYDEL